MKKLKIYTILGYIAVVLFTTIYSINLNAANTTDIINFWACIDSGRPYALNGDLSGYNLSNADLNNAEICNGDFSGASFRNAKLTGANISGGNFKKS